MEIICFGDWHIGDKCCNLDKIKKQIEWIKKYKHKVRVILMGDLLNVALKDSVGAGPWEQDIEPQAQIDMAIELLEPIKDVIIGGHIGNHEARVYNDTSINITKNMCKTLGIPYLGSGALHHIRFGDNTYIIYTTHGTSCSTTPQGKLGACMKLQQVAKADVYCFSDDTEILTKDGWKTRDEIKLDEDIMTLNITTMKLEPDNIKKIYDKEFDGDMVHLCNNNVDILVTPEHRIFKKNRDYIKSSNRRKVNSKWGFHTAEYIKDLSLQMMIPTGGTLKNKEDDIEDDMLSLVGWIISEGHFLKHAGHRNAISITQSWEKKQPIIDILDRLKIKCRVSKRKCKGNKFTIDDKEYTTNLDVATIYIPAKFGKEIRKIVDNKNLPEWVFKLSKRQVAILLDALIEGDGYRKHVNSNSMQYYSSDENLINKLQHLLTINGYRTQKHKNKKRGFRLGILKNKVTTELSKSSVKEFQYYKGNVWCIDTNNTTVITRRNGKVAILGNCMGHVHDLITYAQDYMGVDLKDKTLKRTKKYFVTTGHFLNYGGYAEQKNYAPSKTGVAKIKLFADKWDIHISI